MPLNIPHQPYNGNPHMHPGEWLLLRIIGTGRWQHPFHEHGNHVRVLARDGNLILSATNPSDLAGPLLFTTTTTPGLTMDGIFYWTSKGLNWIRMVTTLPPDLRCPAPRMERLQHRCPHCNQLFRVVSGSQQANAGAPIRRRCRWRSDNSAGSDHLRERSLVRRQSLSRSGCNGPRCRQHRHHAAFRHDRESTDSEAGFAFMWHSHNEREITTNNVFPGGMLMMMLVDSREFVIDESK